VKAFENYEHLGSGRFYIWSRSIPLLKKTWLIGYGPDHFTYNFPQTDYVGKNMQNMRMVNTVVDKPHNMYLQYAINIGVIPLLILLAFWGMLLFELFKIVQKEELDDIYLTVAAAAFSSIIGFMAVGMFNDSTVNVSSVFWGIVGLGLAVVNYNRYDHVRFKEEK
jgi:O-antigen ligase